MGKTFTLIDVVQEPLWFPDDHYGGDGTRYEVRTADLLGAEDYARYLWHQEEARRASATLARRDTDKDARVAAGRTLEQVVNEQIAIIIPKLSVERIATMPLGYKGKILEWWRSEQPEAQAGEAQPGQRVIRGKRSPGSAASTEAGPRTT